MHRIVYADLAAYLRQLSMAVTCADLADHLRRYQGTDEAMRVELAAAVQALQPETGWLDGLMEVCEVLKRQNPRFESAIFVDDLVLQEH